jgi:26S proteasome regulatory subunit N7
VSLIFFFTRVRFLWFFPRCRLLRLLIFSLFLNAFHSELSRFIANGRLHATIDKVHGIVETTRPSLKNAQYETVVKRGDVLLNSVQRLSKVLY